MRVALYGRVSTREQSVDPQLDTLRNYMVARGLDVVEEYIDHGISGAKDRRPALDEMLAKAKLRAFDAVAVVKLDRLARSTRHLTQLAAELEALGVDLIVTTRVSIPVLLQDGCCSTSWRPSVNSSWTSSGSALGRV